MAASKKQARDKYLRYCEICGKLCVIANPFEWKFRKKTKRQTLYFCSWGCMRQYEKKKEKNGGDCADEIHQLSDEQ